MPWEVWVWLLLLRCPEPRNGGETKWSRAGILPGKVPFHGTRRCKHPWTLLNYGAVPVVKSGDGFAGWDQWPPACCCRAFDDPGAFDLKCRGTHEWRAVDSSLAGRRREG